MLDLKPSLILKGMRWVLERPQTEDPKGSLLIKEFRRLYKEEPWRFIKEARAEEAKFREDKHKHRETREKRRAAREAKLGVDLGTEKCLALVDKLLAEIGVKANS